MTNLLPTIGGAGDQSVANLREDIAVGDTRGDRADALHGKLAEPLSGDIFAWLLVFRIGVSLEAAAGVLWGGQGPRNCVASVSVSKSSQSKSNTHMDVHINVYI